MITPDESNCKTDYSPNLSETLRFLKIMAGSEPVTFQTFDDSDQKRRRLAQIIHGELTPKIYQKLKELSGDGAGIYWTVNQTDLKGRTAENVIAVRSHFVDLDGAPLQPVLDAPTKAHVIIESSPARFHPYWVVSDCPLERFRAIQEALIAKFNGDPAVKDLPRVMRMPGFYHRKTEDGKLKNPGPDGKPFMTRIVAVHEAPPYTVQQLIDGLGLHVEEHNGPRSKAPQRDRGDLKLVLSGVPEGERDDRINRYAWHLLAKGNSAMEIAVLVKEAAKNSTPPFPEEEALKKLDRALQKFKERPEHWLTDMGNAERLASAHGDRIRHSSRLGWLVYDGRRWVADDLAQLQGLAKDTARAIWAEVANEPDENRRRDLAKFALKSQSAARIQAMIELLPSEPGISLPHDTFDQDKMLLNALNGTIDLRTGKLRHHAPHDLITKLSPVQLNPEADCPLWKTFVSQVLDGDEGLVAFWQRFIGYAATGIAKEQVWAFLWGKGENGKGTTLDTIRHVLGDYAFNTPPETFLETTGGAIRNDLARLRGARLITASEPAAAKFDPAILKTFTGEDPITARYLHREFFEFQPEGKLLFSANNRPVVKDTSHAFWRRVLMIPFTRVFTGANRDSDLREKLKVEDSGILNWIIKGCLAWQSQGLNPPKAVTDAVNDYRTEQDLLGDFLDTHCVMGQGKTVTVKNLFAAYENYCEASSIRRPFSRQRFNEDLNQRIGISQGLAGISRTRTWFGIALAADEVDEAKVVQGDFRFQADERPKVQENFTTDADDECGACLYVRNCPYPPGKRCASKCPDYNVI